MKLNYKRTIFVGFAFFLISAFWQAYDTLIPKILTDKFGMPQMVSGIVMALDNVLALFLLPLFGALSDRHRGKHGRRTPFILVGTLIAAILLMGLSFADRAQLSKLDAVSTVDDPTALSVLYEEADELSVRFDDKSVTEIFSEEEFTAIRSNDGTQNYNDYVVPLRQSYALSVTKTSPLPFIMFAIILLFTLVSMGTFRSPAVALMPDVTPRPLRSKANAIINLMGSFGGILILVLGILLGTGKTANALMSYTLFFGIVAAIMLTALVIFRLRVNEPKLVLAMKEESRAMGIKEEEMPEANTVTEKVRLPREKLISLLLILSSVVFWFMGYNAVTSKYSVYASSVLTLDYNTTLIIAQGAAIISYLPIGFLSSKFGRKKTILAGIVLLGTAFLAASFMRAGSSPLVMNILFAMAGIGWATISVNSYPMVVELATGGSVGKYTGFYYTASMAAQTATPVLSGFLMDKLGMTTLFPYATVFLAIAFITMLFVKHGESKKTD